MQRYCLNVRLCKSIIEICRCSSSFRCFFLNSRIAYSVSNLMNIPPLKKLQIKYDSNIEIYNNLLDGICGPTTLIIGMLVHSYLVKVNPTWCIFLWNKLLNLYCKTGPLNLARRFLDTIPYRNTISYNTMLTCYMRGNHVDEAVHLYSKMNEERIMSNHVTFSVLIGGGDNLPTLHFRNSLHAQAIQYGLCSDEFVGSHFVECYAKHKSLEDAIRAFGEISKPDLVSCNIMIDGCARNNCKNHAFFVFFQMLQENMSFDGFTLTSIVKTCLQEKDLHSGMLLHGYAVRSGFNNETPMCNSLITMYSRCEKTMTDAVKMFREVLEPTMISWTAMVVGFMQNQSNREATEFYQEMLRLGVMENNFYFASILPVYSNLANLKQGRQIHARIAKSWFGLDMSVNNALIDMYSQCGSLEDAHTVFKTMRKRDVISFTTMITCFGQHGKGKESIRTLKELISEGMKPDDVTFLGCLTACTHGGLIDEGIHVFRMMVDVYNLVPKEEHFACVVDLLGRAGRLIEAEGFIKELRIESNVLVWEALLNASRLHREMEIGERSVKKIMELEPKGRGAYALLANMYADMGLWEDKGAMREKSSVSFLQKDIGYSRVA